MTAQLKIKEIKENEEENETILPRLPRAYYEEVVRETLGILWHQKRLIVGILLVALSLASIALVLIGPRYSAEAMIQLNFTREEPTAGTKIQPIASIDAVALVDGALRVIRSRATASAVVARLGLDKDPDFARASNMWRVFSIVRQGFGLAAVEPSQRDLAVNELMRKITVTSQARSYLISVATTAGDPERAARLANAVALEYLRGQMLQQLADTQAAAERELTQLSSVYGVRHPSYVLARTRLDTLQNRLTALRDGPPDDDTVRLVIGQSFVAADKTFVPSPYHFDPWAYGGRGARCRDLAGSAACGERSDGILHLSASTIAAIDPQAILGSAPQRSSRRRAKFGSLGTILANHSANSSAALMSSAARLTLIAASRLSRSSRMSRQALFENGHKHPRHVLLSGPR